jgi:hypothetical protein
MIVQLPDTLIHLILIRNGIRVGLLALRLVERLRCMGVQPVPQQCSQGLCMT